MKKINARTIASLLAAAILAAFALTAYNDGNSKKNDDEATYNPITGESKKLTTLNGKTFVCKSWTSTAEYLVSQQDSYTNNGTPYKKETTTYTNFYYITGTSDNEAKSYSCTPLSSSHYESSGSYTIDGDKIKFTWHTVLGDTQKEMTIINSTSFKESGSTSSSSFTDASGTAVTVTYSTSDQVYEQGDAPASNSSNTTYSN